MLTRPSPDPLAPPAHSLGLMDSSGTVMLASDSSVVVGCRGGPGGSGDAAWRRPVAPEPGGLQLLLLCRSRSVSRGAGCCFSLVGGRGIRGVTLRGLRGQRHREGWASWLSLMAGSDASLSFWPGSPHLGTSSSCSPHLPAPTPSMPRWDTVLRSPLTLCPEGWALLPPSRPVQRLAPGWSALKSCSQECAGTRPLPARLGKPGS